LYECLPKIITLLENTLYAGVLGVTTIAFAYVVSDRRFWRLGSYLYQNAMRAITRLFVEIDPIGIMHTYVSELEKKLVNMNSRIASLAGMIRACQEEIRSNENIRNKSLMMVKEASRAGKTIVIAEESRQAGRMQEANITYQDLLTKMQLLYSVLVKYQEISQFLIKDIRREIDVKQRRKQMTDAAYSAIKSARSIINGDPNARAMFDMANEYLANDYAMKIGEIEDFVRMSDSFVSTIDLQNGMYEASAMKMIEEWEKRGDSILLGADQKRLIIEGSYAGKTVATSNTDTPASSGNTQADGNTQKNWFDHK